MAQMVECLPSKHKALSLNFSSEKKNGENGTLIFPDFRGNSPSFPPFNIMSYTAFIMLKYDHSIHSFFRAFIRKEC
jgi:hypothetical protein